ncbi:hypothetical protein LCGC14_2257020, partial [marine sediment metagenome]
FTIGVGDAAPARIDSMPPSDMIRKIADVYGHRVYEQKSGTLRIRDLLEAPAPSGYRVYGTQGTDELVTTTISFDDSNIDSNLAMGDANARERRSQGFTPTADGTTTRLTMWLRKIAAPTDKIGFRIETDDGAGAPSGVSLGGGNLVAGSILVVGPYTQIDILITTESRLSSGTVYHLVLTRSGANDAVNYYEVGADTGAGYAGGVANVFTLGSAGQLALAVTGSGAGLLLGGDALLYRSAQTLRTPDSLIVDGSVTATELTISRSDASADIILQRVDAFMNFSQDVGTVQFKGGEDGSEEIVAKIQAVPFDAWTDTSSPTSLVFHTTPVSATSAIERVRIDQNGRVGIGTASPISPLEVEAGLTTVGAILTLGTKEPTVVANDVLGRINFYAPLETGADAISVAASIVALAEGAFDATTNATSLLFQTGASEVATTKMTITSAGDVGIGIAPTSKLHVSVASTGDPGITLGVGSDGTLDYTITRDGGSGILFFQGTQAGATGYRFLSDDDSVLLSIIDNGNVGIGEVAPDSKLEVNGTLHITGASTLNNILKFDGNTIITPTGGSLTAIIQLDALGTTPNQSSRVFFDAASEGGTTD